MRGGVADPLLAPSGVQGVALRISMGHRALVAYERPDETYNLHYSHWGAMELRLKHAIDAKTPFGGSSVNDSWVNTVYGRLQAATQPHLPEVDGEQRPELDVDPEPWAVGITLDEVLSEHLDYLGHEALFVVDRTFDVTAYRTLWLGFEHAAETVSDSPTIGHGLLSTVRWYDGEPVGDGYVRGWFDGAKAILARWIDEDLLTASEATTVLVELFEPYRPEKFETHCRRRDQ